MDSHRPFQQTPCEQKYSQTETKSLAQTWGMNIHRHYLLGIPFDSYTDHQPLIHIYNGNKKGNARIERHRLKVQDFQYTMKYIPGKTNPCDRPSHHPLPLCQYTTQEMDGMVIDLDQRRIFIFSFGGGGGVDKYLGGGGVLLLALAGAWWQRPEKPRKKFNKICFLGLHGEI